MNKMSTNSPQRTELSLAIEVLHERPDVKTLEDALAIVKNRAKLASPPAEQKKHKYGAVRTEIDGITFDSKAESTRYLELKQLEAYGVIEHLRLQPKFDLHVSGVKIGTYVADFSYFDIESGQEVVEDVKGVKTPMYRWKKKHVAAEYGIEITEHVR